MNSKHLLKSKHCDSESRAQLRKSWSAMHLLYNWDASEAQLQRFIGRLWNMDNTCVYSIIFHQTTYRLPAVNVFSMQTRLFLVCLRGTAKLTASHATKMPWMFRAGPDVSTNATDHPVSWMSSDNRRENIWDQRINRMMKLVIILATENACWRS